MCKDLSGFSQEKIKEYENLLRRMYPFFDGCYCIVNVFVDIECALVDTGMFEMAWKVSKSRIDENCPSEVVAIFDFFLKKYGGSIKHLRAKHEKDMESFIEYITATIESIKKDLPEKADQLNFALGRVKELQSVNIHTANCGRLIGCFGDIYAAVLDVLDIWSAQYDLLFTSQKTYKLQYEQRKWGGPRKEEEKKAD